MHKSNPHWKANCFSTFRVSTINISFISFSRDEEKICSVERKVTLQLKLIVIGFIALIISGCQTINGEPERLYSASEVTESTKSILNTIEQSYYTANSDAERMALRNEYIGQHMYYTDLQFTDFETALTRERQQFGFTSALAAQGLSAAGAVVTPVNTVRILSALTGGVNASRGFYDFRASNQQGDSNS